MGVSSADRSRDALTTRGRHLITSAVPRLRPGAVLSVALIAVVGGAGVITLDLELIITGFVAALAVMALNIVVIAIRHWHVRNTRPGATYTAAEDVVRLRRPQRRR